MRKFWTLGLLFLSLLTACGGNDDRVAELEAQLAELTAQQTTTTILAPIESEEPETVAVPNVTGFDKNQASTILQGAGLVAEIDEVASSDAPAGQVLLQTPRAGAEVEPGDTISIRVAVAKTHDLSVKYSVRDGLYRSLGDGACDYRDGAVTEGKSVRLLGPDRVALDAVIVGVGELEDDEESSTGRSCVYNFRFRDLPEVATYEFATENEIYPATSLAQLNQFNWSWEWWYGRL